MVKYIVCDLHILMVKKGIKSVSELQRLTGLPRRTLDKCFHNDSKQIHHNTALLLCEALNCDFGELYRIVDEEAYLKKRENIERSRSYLRNGVVYFVKNPITKLMKIGKTSDIELRLNQLSREYGVELKLVSTIESDDSVKLEKEVHSLFSGKRVSGEWFDLKEEELFEVTKKKA